jgi:hypothetical protein
VVAVLNNLNGVLLAVDAAMLNVLGRSKVGANGARLLEVATLLLGTERSGDDNAQDNDGGRNAHDGSVSGRLGALGSSDHGGLGDGVNDLGGRRGNHVSKLVGDTDEGGAESGGRQFAEMDGNDTPGSLDEELDHEARGGEAALGGGKNPGGDEAAGDESCADNGPATTEPLRSVSKDRAANTGASLHEDRSACGTGRAEMLGLLHECGVAVLAGVGVVVEPGHEEDTVDTHAPLCLEHDLGLSPEGARCLSLATCLLCLDELLRLGEADADKSDSNGETGSDPEDSLPCVGCSSNSQVGAGSEHVTERVSLLEDTTHETTSVGRAVLKCHGDSIAIDTAHKKAKQGADSQELVEGCRVDGGDLKKTENDHVHDHGPFATVI